MSEAAWQAECERVASKLVITAPADAGGAWRPLLDRALASLASLQAAAPAAMAAVDGAGQELASSTEALAAAEEAADAELADLRAEHKAAVAAVAVLQQEQAAGQEYVASLEQELQFLNKVRPCCRQPLACWRLLLRLDAGGCWSVPADKSEHAAARAAEHGSASELAWVIATQPSLADDYMCAACAGAGGAAAGGGAAGGQQERQPPGGAPGAGLRCPAGGAAGHGCAHRRAAAPAAADHGQEQRLSRLKGRLRGQRGRARGLHGCWVHLLPRCCRPVGQGSFQTLFPVCVPVPGAGRSIDSSEVKQTSALVCCKMRHSDQRPLPARPSASRRRLRRRAAQTSSGVCACVGVPRAAVEAGGASQNCQGGGAQLSCSFGGAATDFGPRGAPRRLGCAGRRRVCR